MRCVVLLLLLAGCAAPPPEFLLGAVQTRHSVNGMRYVLYRQLDRAQLVRIDATSRPAPAANPEALRHVLEDLTGCRIRRSTLRGDYARIDAHLRCPRGKRHP